MSQLIVDQSDWAHLLLTGPDRVRFLQGMCSANIETLAVGAWTRAVILNPKGRLLSIIDVVKHDDALRILCEGAWGEATRDILDRHAIMDDIELELTSGPMHRVWTDPASVWTAPPRLEAAPGPAADPALVEVRRIEAGLPRYGVDVDDGCFPFESLLAQHLDYEKGCYVGQEPIFRVHAQGAPQRFMRGLVAADGGELAVGGTVVHPDRAKAGTLTSAAKSPDFGTIGLAILHRTAGSPGSTVTVDGIEATVVALPFGTPDGAEAG